MGINGCASSSGSTHSACRLLCRTYTQVERVPPMTWLYLRVIAVRRPATVDAAVLPMGMTDL